MLADIFLVFYLLISYYTLKQIHYWIDQAFSDKSETIKFFMNFVFAIAISLPLLGTFLPQGINYYFQKAGNIWYGIYVYFGAFLVLAHLFRAIVNKMGKDRHVELMEHHYTARGVFVFAAVFCLVLNAYGMMNAKTVRKTTYDLDIAKKAESGKMKIVLLADYHLSVNSSKKHMKEMTDMVNRENPDLILIAGDFFTSSYKTLKDPEDYIKILGRMKAKHGIYAVYGNHDVEERLVCGFAVSSYRKALRDPRMTSFIKKCGYTILDDDNAVLGNGVQIIGRRDFEKPGDGSRHKRKSIESLSGGLDRNRPIICLEHEPNDFKTLEKSGTDLVLSGHTHDGQIFPGNIIAGLFNENSYGLKKVGSRKKMYSLVTSGVGFYGPPIRIGTISEIAVININFR